MTTSIRDFAVWNGLPVSVFPSGAHVFPADLEALLELASRLCEDLREEHEVDVALVRRIQGEGLDPDEDPTLVRRLSLPGVRGFLSRRRPEFGRLAHRHVVENTLAHGRARLEQLRALGAPDVIIEHDEA